MEKIQERLERTTLALEQSGIPYAIIGGNAVRAWMARADEAAVRTTRDVDILLRRSDWPAAKAAMESAGFIHRPAAGMDTFVETPDARARDAVQIVFSGENTVWERVIHAPDVSEVEMIQNQPIIKLEALVRMQLIAFRSTDRMHLADLIDVGLVDESWCHRFPLELATRLGELLDDPIEWHFHEATS